MTIDQNRLHRTAKYFMDNGRAASAEDAMAMLGGFGLTIEIDHTLARSLEGQIALLTLVNSARRTLLGGVEVVGVRDEIVATRLGAPGTLRDAVAALGGRFADASRSDWPRALIGRPTAPNSVAPAWRLHWAGWRGGVVPAGWTTDPAGAAIALAPAMASAACVAEVFAWHAGDHVMAGHRAAGLSLWQPGHDWLSDDVTEPELRFLPGRLWLIGLGNLGQAFAWALAALPYADPAAVELMLQDFDRMAPSNDSTSLLARPDQPPIFKTRWVSSWLEARGFDTRLTERHFTRQTQRIVAEPSAAFCGVDNALARAALEEAGFDLIVEAGLGAGPQGFRTFALHCFPGPKAASAIWGTGGSASVVRPDVEEMPAYQALRAKGMNGCGLTQLAQRTVGVPFVGLTAALLAVSELLRRLHGAPATELVVGSLGALEDVEQFIGGIEPYAHGHVEVAGLSNPAAVE